MAIPEENGGAFEPLPFIMAHIGHQWELWTCFLSNAKLTTFTRSIITRSVLLLASNIFWT